MRYIDLRSDTVTQPTQAMRDAMAAAVVGDDVFNDDPTLHELEAYAAERLGKEAAVFVTSGMQGNACALLAHTRRGDCVIIIRISPTTKPALMPSFPAFRFVFHRVSTAPWTRTLCAPA